MNSPIFNFDEIPSVIFFDNIDSTINEAERMIKGGYAYEGDIIIADQQINGRGRDNRNWESQKNNLFLSFILTPNIAIQQLELIGFIFAASCIRILNNEFNGNQDFGYKWPNDIMLNNKKLGGILIKSYLQNGSNICQNAICSMGLNIKQHPKNILSTDIFHETARILDRNKLMMLVLNEFEKNYIEYKHGKNIADIINYLKENSNFLGKEISVNHQQKLKVGICEDIDIKGNLILNIDGTIDKINYGDIFESIS